MDLEPLVMVCTRLK